MKKMPIKVLCGLGLILLLTACDLNLGQPQQATPTANNTPAVTAPVSKEVGAEMKIEEAVTTPVVQNDEVDFNKPLQLDTLKVLGGQLKAMEKILGDTASTDKNGQKTDDPHSYVKNMVTFYDVGKIKIKPYQDQKLLVIILGCDGPCMSYQTLRFAWDETSNKLTMLEKMSNLEYLPDFIKPLQKGSDSNFQIKALDLPNTIMLPDGNNSIQLEQRDVDLKTDKQSEGTDEYGLSFVNLGKPAFNDPRFGTIYLSQGVTGCLIVIAPDSTVSTYTYDPKLTDKNHGATVIWDEGHDTTALGDNYQMKTGGCGIGGNCYLIETSSSDNFVKVGKTDKGLDIYQAKDQSRIADQAKLDALVDTNQPLFDLNYDYNTYLDEFKATNDQSGAKAKTYEEFLADRPILYWQDPFGRFSGLVNSAYTPPAECGKPVIYLYPEKDTKVSVKVGIDQFTKTEPAYGNGWEVLAKANGELTNLADGKKYEYLFWEGKSAKSVALRGGSVVAKADLEEFLTVSLKKLGLSEKEAAEFKDFWLPKMQATEQPYLLISFLGTQEFNKIAPLTIEPKPNTLLRVFMYYQPLASKIQLPEQKLTAPARQGFTVVEWGGTSSDAWQIR